MINYFKLFLISLLFFYVKENSTAQITLSNKSMEGQPADATMPTGWFAQSEGTTPDILPGYWGVYTEPDDGDTYIGLITRQDGSFESIGQRLEQTIQEGQCYKFKLSLAHSDNYSGYNKPVHLKVWLGSKNKSRDQLIFLSPLIDHLDWEKYSIEFKADSNFDYLIIEAFISEEPSNHKGNILIDNLTPIYDCHRA